MKVCKSFTTQKEYKMYNEASEKMNYNLLLFMNNYCFSWTAGIFLKKIKYLNVPVTSSGIIPSIFILIPYAYVSHWSPKKKFSIFLKITFGGWLLLPSFQLTMINTKNGHFKKFQSCIYSLVCQNFLYFHELDIKPVQWSRLFI